MLVSSFGRAHGGPCVPLGACVTEQTKTPFVVCAIPPLRNCVGRSRPVTCPLRVSPRLCVVVAVAPPLCRRGGEDGEPEATAQRGSYRSRHSHPRPPFCSAQFEPLHSFFYAPWWPAAANRLRMVSCCPSVVLVPDSSCFPRVGRRLRSPGARVPLLHTVEDRHPQG